MIAKLKNPRAEVRRCRVCACTDAWGCEAGCEWVEWDLCSECVDMHSRQVGGKLVPVGAIIEGRVDLVVRNRNRDVLVFYGSVDVRSAPLHRFVVTYKRRTLRGIEDYQPGRLVAIADEWNGGMWRFEASPAYDRSQKKRQAEACPTDQPDTLSVAGRLPS